MAAGTGLGRAGIFSLGLVEGGTTAVGLEADWRMLAIPGKERLDKLRPGDELGESNVGNTEGSSVAHGASAVFGAMDGVSAFTLGGLDLELEV